MALRKFLSKNPFTQEVFKEYPFATSPEAALASSFAAFNSHKRSTFTERAAKIHKLGELFKEKTQELSRLISWEMGKPISQARKEVLKCAESCFYYAANAESLLKPLVYEIPGVSCQVEFAPSGPLLCIMPFNFPIWTPIKTSVPHLMAGNTIIMKPPENTPQCALALDDLTTAAGLAQEFQTAFFTPQQIAEALADRRVAGVSLTGSARAGKAVALLAAQHLKKSVLELGGSDPFLVLEDADVGLAVELLVCSRIQVSGQVCNSPKRIIVHSSVYDAFLSRLIVEVAKFEVSDPLSEDCNLGPLARDDLLENVVSQVQRSVAMGATVAYGGQVLGPCRYQPVVLTEVTLEMPVCAEETFGPVFSVVKVNSEQEAVQCANHSEYGLSCVIITGDPVRAKTQIAPQIQSGMVFVNDFTKSFVHVPCGGVKDSGTGRELGVLGIREFTHPRTIVVKQ